MIIRTVCAHDCPDMCSLLAHVEDGRLVAFGPAAGFFRTGVHRQQRAQGACQRAHKQTLLLA